MRALPRVAVPRVAVLGAGPVGIEAALAVAQRGWDTTVYEQAPHVAASVRDWGHVRMFTPCRGYLLSLCSVRRVRPSRSRSDCDH